MVLLRGQNLVNRMNLAPEKQNFKIKSALEVLPFINGLY
ncbi:hypothetical protein ASZ90_017995 [hydrocarbon metagenome]|uniref:Uncharacterized protein n=1 Tax=hydrocarbon metagenome TaxID=938273 RepID=A0A0W8E7N2_9ZZZZ